MYEDATQVSTIYEDATQVSTIYEDATQVSTIYEDATQVSTIYEDATQVSTIYEDATQVSTIYEDATQVSTIYEDATQVSTIYEDATSATRDTTMPAPASSIEILVVTGCTYLLEGEDLVLTCSLPDNYLGQYTAANLSFRHSWPSQPQSTFECVPESSLQVISEKTAKLNISKVTFCDAGQYTCFAGDTQCRFGVNHTSSLPFGFVNDVNIEYTPRNVTNFRCEVYNYYEYMVCTWQHPVQYKNWANIQVDVLYSVTSLNPSVNCPKQTNTSCSWDPPQPAFYKIQVCIRNKPKNKTVCTTFEIDSQKIVKPAPIENLTIKPSGNQTGCLLISWLPPTLRAKVYRIQQQVVGAEQFTILSNNSKEESYTWCGYHPYTHHNVSVECLPAGVYDGNYSDPVFKDVWTPMAEPGLGPRSTNGSFTSTQCNDGTRNVTLMWQAVDPDEQNGNITGYIIKQGRDNLAATDAGVFSATVVLACHPVSVAILAVNNAGLSISPTILLISTTTVSTEVQNSFVVEIKNSETLLASWQEADEVTGEVTYTIFWCEGRLEQFCQGKIQWQEVPAGATEFAIPGLSSQASEYIYGISTRNVVTGVASQLFWARCLFKRDPTQLPAISTMDVKGLEGGVYITWAADRCNYQDQVRYTSFVVKWCQTSQCGEPSQISNATVGVAESTFTVASLAAGVNYSFTVQPISYDTPGREVQPWKTAVPSARDQADTLISLGAVLGGLASAAVVLLLAIFVCRVCQERRKKFKRMEEPLNLLLLNGVAQEFGPHLNERMLEGSHAQQTYLEFINEGSSIRSSDESESGILPRSTDGYSKLAGDARETCNNVQDPESGQPENDSALKEHGYMQQPSLTSPHVIAAPNGYCRLAGHGSIPEVCTDLQARESRQPEQDSRTVPGSMPRPSHTETSDEVPRARSSLVSYSRVIGDGADSCNIVQDPESGHCESTSTGPGYMPHPISQTFGKASNKGNSFIAGTSQPSVFTVTHSNQYVLHVNAMSGIYSEEEDTHAGDFSVLKPMDVAVGSIAGEISEATLVLGHSRGSARIQDGEISEFSDHRTTETVAERHELDYQTATETAGDKFGFDYHGPTEIDDVYRSAETAGESSGLGNYHRTTETDPERHASVPSTILRAGSHSPTSDAWEGRTTVPADINQGHEISAKESDADNSSLEQNLRDLISHGSPENDSALSGPSNQRSISGEDSGTTPSSLEYIQLTRFNCSDTDS
ncbi:hypothetical protein BsWGS_03107 [Bradybaena similaris]